MLKSVGQQGRLKARKFLKAAVSAFCVCVLAGWLAAGEAQAAPGQSLRIGTTSYTGKRDNIWETLLSHLQVKLNAKLELVRANDFPQILALLKDRKIDFAYLTPFDYLQASRQVGIEALAVQMLPDGKPGYYSVLVTKKSSGIQTLEQAKGKTLGVVARDSVSGFEVQAWALNQELKLPLSAYFQKPVFAGTHLKVIQGLQKGDFEVGATNTKDLKNSSKLLGLDPAGFNVIWKSGFIPESVFAARKELPADLKTSFANALFSLNGNKEELTALNIGGYARPGDVDFSLIKGLDAYLQKNKLAY